MNHWLMKSEPDEFGIDDLIKRPQQTEPWTGVRNYQVRNWMRDVMRVGDLAFFYHSSCPVPGIAGVMKISKAAYPDPTAFNPESPYYDPKSTKDNPRWFCVEVKFVNKFKAIITLESLKKNPALKNMRLLQKGNRLSILPISAEEWKLIEMVPRLE